MIQLAIVADDHVYREALALALESARTFLVGLQAADLEEILPSLSRQPVDVVLLDLGRPAAGARDGISRLRALAPEIKILALGMPDEEGEILGAIEAGVSGYVLKRSCLRELRESLETLARGETLCSPRIARSLFARLAELSGGRARAAALDAIAVTRREREILELIAEGLSNKEIAARLHVSLATVKNHVHNILEKLQVRGRSRAVALARERRWLRPGSAGML